MNFRFFFDLILLISAYSISVYLKDASFFEIFSKFSPLFISFSFIYIIVSFATKKYQIKLKSSNISFFKKHIFCWGISTLVLLSSIYIFQIDFPSRVVILGFLIILLVLNILWLIALMSYKYANIILSEEDIEHFKAIKSAHKSSPQLARRADVYSQSNTNILDLIFEERGSEVLDFITTHINKDSLETEYLNTTSRFNILKIQYISKNIVNLAPLNNIGKLNKFIESVSVKLEFSGYFISCAITNETRKRQILTRYPSVINQLIYFLYFVYHRVFPKLAYIKYIYFYFNKKINRSLSSAEILGRHYSCGFEHINHKIIGNYTWYVMGKKSEPILDFNPTYGPLIRLKRIGKNGKIMDVYKLRTMHPYSEFIQKFVYDRSDLDEGGKFKNDFRITTLGKICRKFWIDELPMIINIIKGDLKLVGVRPLSEQYFSLYPEDFQKYRINFKPGLLPPFYVDLPKDIDEIVASEKKYLELYVKKPFRTDVKYFFLILKNIIFKRVRSQ